MRGSVLKSGAFGTGIRRRHVIPTWGAAGIPGATGAFDVRKLVVRQRLRLFPASLPFPFGNGRTAAGGHGVNTLIRRGLRENAESGPLTPLPAASGVCPALFGVCPVVVRVTKCCPCGELQAGCAMEYDQDKVDEMVLALLSLTMFEETRWGESVEGARLGCNGSAAREGLHLRPEEQGQISCGYRKVSGSRELFEKAPENRKAQR